MQERSAYLFLSSAAMWPGRVNAAYPGARFLARACVTASNVRVAAYFSQAVTEDVWGLLLAAPERAPSHGEVTVTTDDGQEFIAELVEPELLTGDPQEVLAAARYWELPPRFVAQLRDALQSSGIVVEDEEPRDDGNLG